MASSLHRSRSQGQRALNGSGTFGARWNWRRVSYLVEALAFSAFVAWYIWRLQAAVPWSWRVFVGWLVLSFLIRRDTLKTLGWREDNLWPAAVRAFGFLLWASVGICGAGVFLGMLHRLPQHLVDARRFAGYLAFCLLQQVAFNSFLTNRLLAAFADSWRAVLLAGVLFSALHWPNPVLVPLTLIGGTAMAWLFERERNILPLTFVQAILGALVWWAFPLAWHHSMRVGPGYAMFHL